MTSPMNHAYYPPMPSVAPPADETPDNIYRWGTITSISPLGVRLDGDIAPLASVPDSVISSLRVGTRVWCQLYRRRVIIVGKAAGNQNGGDWATYSIDGTGFGTGVAYVDTNNHTLLASNGIPFSTLPHPSSPSRVHIDVTGWYSLTGRFAMDFTTGAAGRGYYEYRVWETQTAPASAYIYRSGLAYDESNTHIGVPYVHLDEGNEISIGTYSQSYTYNLEATWNVYTIRLIEATA